MSSKANHRPTEQHKSAQPALVAIGGSLASIERVLDSLPTLPHTSFVLVPTDQGLTPSLLSKAGLRTEELYKDVVPTEGTFYVVPLGTGVVFKDGMLVPSPSNTNALLDDLFESFALSGAKHLVGVVLDGTRGDGWYGLQILRDSGALTIVQRGAEQVGPGCRFPHFADLIVPLNDIGKRLQKLVPLPKIEPDMSLLSASSPKLFNALDKAFNVDFRLFQSGAVARCVARRMVVLGVPSFEAYLRLCTECSQEVGTLGRAIVNPRTSFFRDPVHFDQLRNVMARRLKKRDGHPLRVWVVGCSTGEEAYSIAILMAELFGGLTHLNKANVKIFATDIDCEAVDTARAGTYPAAAMRDIPENLVKKYFVKDGDRLVVRKELRAVTLFSCHNILKDTPFANIDMLSIRYVLPAFEPKMKDSVLNRLNSTLVPNGALCLGVDEGIGDMRVFFQECFGAAHVFEKRAGISADTNSQTKRLGETPAKRPRMMQTNVNMSQAGPSFRRPGDVFKVLDKKSDRQATIGFGEQDQKPIAATREDDSELAQTALQQLVADLQKANSELRRDNEDLRSRNENLLATCDMLEVTVSQLKSSTEDLLDMATELQKQSPETSLAILPDRTAHHSVERGHFSVEGPGRAVTWDDATFELLGYAPDSIAPSVDALLDRLHHADRAIAADSMSDALTHGQSFAFLARVIGPDQSELTCRFQGDCESVSEGLAWCVMGVVDVVEKEVWSWDEDTPPTLERRFL